MMNRPYCPGPFLERGLILPVHCYFVTYILASSFSWMEISYIKFNRKISHRLFDSKILDKIEVIFGKNLSFQLLFLQIVYILYDKRYLKKQTCIE